MHEICIATANFLRLMMAKLRDRLCHSLEIIYTVSGKILVINLLELTNFVVPMVINY